MSFKAFLLTGSLLTASSAWAQPAPIQTLGPPPSPAVLTPAPSAPAALTKPPTAPDPARMAPPAPAVSAEGAKPAAAQPPAESQASSPTPAGGSGTGPVAPLAQDGEPPLPDSVIQAFVDQKPVGSRETSEERRRREAIAAFYASRQNAPLWLGRDGWTARARTLAARLREADQDGLDAKALHVPDLAGADDAAREPLELQLSEAAVLYGEEASGGRVNPRVVSALIAPAKNRLAPEAILPRLAQSDDPAVVLASFDPPQPRYKALRAELDRILSDKEHKPTIPPGRMLRLGMRDPRVPLLRARLALPAAETNPDVYDRRLVEAVKSFQSGEGLAPNGLLTSKTVAALSDTSRRKADILANMEMWRWSPRDLGEDRIEVNIPDFKLTLYHGETAVHEARVVVGKASTPTPIFSNIVRYVVVNPSWLVPQSIIKKEMLPKLATDPDYLARMGYIVTHRGDEIEVRQPPGDHNALGRIKFLFPNDYAVYLHDTPERALFNASMRDFSHGCVRVQNPFELGEDVLGAANGWSEAHLKKLIGEKERTIRVPKPIAIHIEYFTMFPGPDGALVQRPDVYGYMRKIEHALGATA
jgi:murein L,D-transpeptidase YcbB/YkuD